MKIRSAVLSLAALATLATAAYAAVNFDFGSGTGFVGKGDVQLAFGWNNKQLQSNAVGVDFVYETEARYKVYCEKTIQSKKETKVLEKTFNRKVEISAAVAYDARVKNQITGFNLTGFEGEGLTGGGDVNCTDPHDPSSSGWNMDLDHIGANPELVEGSQSGGLYTTFGGTNVLLLAK